MRINAQLTSNRSSRHEPFSYCDLVRSRKPLYTVSRDHFQICANIQPIIDRSSHQYWFWRGVIAFLVTSDYHFAQAILYNVVPFGPGCFLGTICTRALSILSRAHIQTLSFACSMAGMTIKEKVQPTAYYYMQQYVPKGCYRCQLCLLFGYFIFSAALTQRNYATYNLVMHACNKSNFGVKLQLIRTGGYISHGKYMKLTHGMSHSKTVWLNYI